MKRPMVVAALSLKLGILCAHFSHSVLFVCAVAALAATVLFAVRGRTRKCKPAAVMILLFLLGAFEFTYFRDINLRRYESFDGEWLTLRGVVAAHPEIEENRVSYILNVGEIECRGISMKGGKVLVSTMREDGPVYGYGTELEISGELRLPKEKRNPGGFNYREYLLQKGISATLFTKGFNIRMLGDGGGSVFVKAGLAIRQRIMEVIQKSLPPQQAGLMNGMLIGSREGMTEQVTEVFRDSGLSHIIAASGANVAFILAPFLWIFKKIRLHSRLAGFICIAVVLMYLAVTGFDPSIVRASIMAITLLIAQIARRDADVLTSIAFSAFIMLLYNPFYLFNLGFQLSFAATLSLVLFYSNIRKMITVKHLPKGFLDVAAATITAQAGVLPISVLCSNEISVISLFTNLMVVPITGVVTITGAVMAVIGQISISISVFIGYANSALLSFILYASKVAAGLPFAVVRVITPSVIQVAAYYVFLLYFAYYKPLYKIRLKPAWRAAILVAFLLSVLIPMLGPKTLQMVFLDVGQGDSCFFRTAGGKTVLIDGGGKEGEKPGQGVGERIVEPFLLDQGIKKIDVVIVSHAHADHMQGLIPVIRDFKVENLMIPRYAPIEDFKSIIGPAEEKGVQIHLLGRGDRLKLDEATTMDVLAPFHNENFAGVSLNNTSIVLKLLYKDMEVLFTGDIEQEVEESLLECAEELEADLLKVAHHGSATSTSEDFLRAVNPKAAVISVGENNFGHPAPVVLDRLQSGERLVFRTDRDGAVLVKTDGRKIKFTRMVR